MDLTLTIANLIIIVIFSAIMLLASRECYVFLRHRFSFTKKHVSPTLFLQQQKCIRIVADNAPGYGNQVASMNIASQLRQMGFKGIFEFIYPETIMLKIAKLFDLPEALGSSYFDKKRNMEFIQLQHFIKKHHKGESKRLALGFTGAFDEENQQLLANYTLNPDYLYNYADLLNVDTFIRWQPYLDKQGDTAIFIHKLNDPIKQIDSYKKFIPIPRYDFSAMQTYLYHTREGQRLLTEKPALLSLIHAIEKEDVNFLPVYGYHLLIKNWRKTKHFPEHLLEILLGARYAQLNGKNCLEKPLIVAVFFDYQLESQTLLRLLESGDWEEYEKTGAELARQLIATFRLKENLFTSHLDELNCGKRIAALKPGQLLLLSMGVLPKIVFDGFYTHSAANVLPPIREGANSFNHLIVSGRPHIRCHDVEDKMRWELGFETGSEDINKRLAAFYQHTFKGMEKWEINNPIQWIGDFILDTLEPNSTLTHYFELLKEIALKPENDRIHTALEVALCKSSNQGVIKEAEPE
jgi:hypothetical protein